MLLLGALGDLKSYPLTVSPLSTIHYNGELTQQEQDQSNTAGPTRVFLLTLLIYPL